MADYQQKLYRYGDEYYSTNYFKVKKLMRDSKKKGRKQSYGLGVWLRQRYGPLFSDPKKIYVRTTDKERVKESARCCLAAMFPNRGSSRNKNRIIAAASNNSLTNKVGTIDCTSKIELHTQKAEDDYILGYRARCDAYTEEYEKLYSSKEILVKNNAFKNVYATIKEKSGSTGNDRFVFIHRIYDTVLVERELNLQPDQWAVNIMPEMKKASILSFTIATWTNKLKSLATGPLLGQMIKDMKEKVRNKIDLEAKLYYAHDLTIVNVLNTLGVYDMKELPGYAACVLLELIDAGLGKYDVKLYYSQTTKPRVKLLIHTSLEDFITSTKHLIPLDWHKECNSSSKKAGRRVLFY